MTEEKGLMSYMIDIHSKVSAIEANTAHHAINLADVQKRVTALEHLKLAIVGGATVVGGILGVFFDKIKSGAGALLP